MQQNITSNDKIHISKLQIVKSEKSINLVQNSIGLGWTVWIHQKKDELFERHR